MLQAQVTGRKGDGMWDGSVLDGLHVLHWPGHPVKELGICVLEWPLSAVKQEADQVAGRRRAKLCRDQNTVAADRTAQGRAESGLAELHQGRAGAAEDHLVREGPAEAV